MSTFAGPKVSVKRMSKLTINWPRFFPQVGFFLVNVNKMSSLYFEWLYVRCVKTGNCTMSVCHQRSGSWKKDLLGGILSKLLHRNGSIGKIDGNNLNYDRFAQINLNFGLF